MELEKRRGRDGNDNLNVGDTDWNLRGIARAEGGPAEVY